jgi:cysteine desulfurase family protein (TIGR01976 family)
MTKLDLAFVRSQFPALEGGECFFDNGGGSQILRPVLDRLQEFLVRSNVQLGATYATSAVAAERMAQAHRAVAALINATDPDEVVMGPSTTALLSTLACSLAHVINPGDEVIVTDGDHEANIAPWVELEQAGAVVRFWQVDPSSGELDIEALGSLLSDRTRFVAMTHASNVLGSINPVRRVADMVHEVDAWLCVDGVGFAPHRAVDVQALDADFYAFSFYKTFGPHHAVLYGRRHLLETLPGQGFYFIPEDAVPYKHQRGNVNYELSYSLLGLLDYLQQLAGVEPTAKVGPAVGPAAGVDDWTRTWHHGPVAQAFDQISLHEERLSESLLAFLRSKSGVRVIGSPRADRAERVSIISFVSDRMSSKEVVESVDRHGIGIRYGHFYSARLIDALGLRSNDGVVRVSMVHYNTLEEVADLIAILDPLL